MAIAQNDLPGSALTPKQIFLALTSVFVGYFIYSYYLQTLNIAAPKIAADLNGMALYSWSVSIPGLGLAVGTLFAGKLSDIYGRRVVLLVSLIIGIIGTVLSALSPTFISFIASRTFLLLGMGSMAPLSSTVIGDIYAGGVERSKWIGLLNIPFGLPCVIGPTLSGWLVDNLSWRHIFWWIVPLIVVCTVITYTMPSLLQGTARKIDVAGGIMATVSLSALIFGLSFAGTTYPWLSKEVIGLLAIALIFGLLFLRAESRAAEPILDLALLKNRVFMTVSIAGFLSFFGVVAIALYYPLLMQGIQGMSAMESGQIITPFGVLMAFCGVPTGFLIARTKRYKYLYIVGSAMITAVLFGMIYFGQDTPVFWGVTAAVLAGLGLGTIPTINTLVTQAAVPKKLLGVAMGALFFSIAMGMALAPALEGSAMNMTYSSSLKASLPAALNQVADEAIMTSIGNPRVLLSESAMNDLRESLIKRENGQALFEQTVAAIRFSMESGLRMVFIIAAILTLISFLMIITIPPISLEAAEEKEVAKPVATTV